MTDAELHDAILADPAAKAMADVGNDGGCATRMSAILPAVPDRYLPARTLIYFGALTGTRAKMQQAANDNTSPVQSLAISYMDMIRDANGPGLDTMDPAIVGTGGMLDAFTAAGIFAASGAGSKAQLLSMVVTTPAVVTADQVSQAMEPDRPGGRIV